MTVTCTECRQLLNETNGSRVTMESIDYLCYGLASFISGLKGLGKKKFQVLA